MGLLDRLFGRDDSADAPRDQDRRPPSAPPGPGTGEDERAVARYRYLLRTAPPEQIEQAHAEAFARLTPEQRRQVLGRLSGELPPGEEPTDDQPQTLARAATRAEMREPGTLQRSFAGPGTGSVIAGSMLGTVAGVVVGSMVAQSLLGGYEQSPEAGEVGEAGPGADGEATADETGEWGGDAGGQWGGGDVGGDFGGDFGGGFGDF